MKYGLKYMFITLLYISSLIFIAVSYKKNKIKIQKTMEKTKKDLLDIFPKFLCLLIGIQLVVEYMNEDIVMSIIGKNSNILGLVISGMIGSITLMPTIVAYPLARQLLELGVSYGQVTMFITCLTMVGILTFGIEKEYLGKRVAIVRNICAFIFALITAIILNCIFK